MYVITLTVICVWFLFLKLNLLNLFKIVKWFNSPFILPISIKLL